jgi:hypothetical protein
MPDGTERRDLAVEYRPLDSLVAYARNARTQTSASAKADSGWILPLLLWYRLMVIDLAREDNRP